MIRVGKYWYRYLQYDRNGCFLSYGFQYFTCRHVSIIEFLDFFKKQNVRFEFEFEFEFEFVFMLYISNVI